MALRTRRQITPSFYSLLLVMLVLQVDSNFCVPQPHIRVAGRQGLV
jgi:hypothetical protein